MGQLIWGKLHKYTYTFCYFNTKFWPYSRLGLEAPHECLGNGSGGALLSVFKVHYIFDRVFLLPGLRFNLLGIFNHMGFHMSKKMAPLSSHIATSITREGLFARMGSHVTNKVATCSR